MHHCVVRIRCPRGGRKANGVAVVDRIRRPANVKEPHVRHIRGQLWEIRLKGTAGIARALYVTAKEERVVIVRAFIKKTEKTPAEEIDLALQRAKELKS
ncbi:MAG TPA: type II toxin-antitoxin system RelE/ParE family toxin [Vicinamibacterales bacterium]|nr:type II toxin-antitoxin system RelE/ParE family toxin [Vicinamibacterales bacterium]